MKEWITYDLVSVRFASCIADITFADVILDLNVRYDEVVGLSGSVELLRWMLRCHVWFLSRIVTCQGWLSILLVGQDYFFFAEIALIK